MKIKSNISKKSGVAILFSILIIGILISIVTVLSNIFSVKIRLSAETKYSAGAFYAAESGVEHCLYKRKDPGAVLPVMVNNASFTTTNCESGNIKSTGKYLGVSRALEISF